MNTTGLNGTMFCDEWALLLFHAWCLYFSISAYNDLRDPPYNESCTSLRHNVTQVVTWPYYQLWRWPVANPLPCARQSIDLGRFPVEKATHWFNFLEYVELAKPKNRAPGSGCSKLDKANQDNREFWLEFCNFAMRFSVYCLAFCFEIE